MMINNERGASLLLVLTIFLLFSILGIILLSMTINGAKQTETKEKQTQAFYLAKKGMDYFYSDFKKTFYDVEKEDLEQLNTKINAFIEPYDKNKENKVTIQNANGDHFSVQVIDYTEKRTEKGTILDTITVQSTGKVQNQTKTLTNTYQLGAQNIPEQLNYAIGAKDESNSHCKESKCNKGNIFIHGPASIVGNMYVGGDLIITDQSQYQKGESYWTKTDYPTMQALKEKEQPKVSLLGNAFTFNTDDTTKLDTYKKHVERLDFENESFDAIVKTNVCIHKPPTGPCKKYGNKEIPKDPYKKITRNIHSIFKEGYTPELEKKPATFKDINIIDSATEIFKNGELQHYNSITENKNLNFDTNGAIFNKGLTIKQNKMSISGPLYIKNGNLTIEDATVNMDSVIYVDGNVTITNSTVNGLKKGSLIIFATGEVKIVNINLYTKVENQKPLRMFIYSNSDLELYGVGSNLQIHGGIFAKRIILNAAKGHTKGFHQLEKNQTNLKPEQSRLRIVYNEDLIQNPAIGLPRVEGIDLTLIKQK